jgi:hypothetical protein
MRAQRQQLCSGLSKAACGEQADRLERKLREVLPPSAVRFLITNVREAIAGHIAETIPRFRGRGAEQRLSRETWAGSDEERAVGVWFVDWFQLRYDNEMERDRIAEEAEDLRRRQEAERLRQWQVRRDEEAGSIARRKSLPKQIRTGNTSNCETGSAWLEATLSGPRP